MKSIDRLLDSKGREIFSVTPDTSVYEAIQTLAERGIGALLVMEGDRLVGLVSERDYARKVILQGKSSRETLVREIMAEKVQCIPPTTKVEEAMALMTEKRVRHLPVVEKKRVLGMISIGDVVKAVISEQEFHIQQLEQYIMTG